MHEDPILALDGATFWVVRDEGDECPLCRLAGSAEDRTRAARGPHAAPGAAFGLRQLDTD